MAYDDDTRRARKGRAPLFLTFEGCDGTGKTTQARLLADGMGAVLTSDPKGTGYGREITDIAIREADGWPQAFAFLSARAKLTEDVIMPALRSGRDVVCDRFMDSTFVYQGMLGGIGTESLKGMTMAASHGVRPGITVLLRFDDLGCLHERIARRAGLTGAVPDRFDGMGLDGMKAVQDGFMSLAEAEPERFIVVGCDGRSVEEIHANITDRVSARLASWEGDTPAL